MNSKKPHDGRNLGIVFTVLSLLSILTYIGPALFIVPAFAFKNLAQLLTGNGFFHVNHDKLATVLLTATLLIVIILFLRMIKKMVIRTGRFASEWISLFFVILCFLVHPCGYFIYSWATFTFGPKEDFGHSYLLIESFPYTSFVFIPIGLLFDAVIHKYTDLFYQYK
ncbi:hypothetical protein GFS24_13390 [Chitinophaga sp. SYP-B3965]|uniref:hypothetical protein n=1 Tax=Chitinophaga sp. SYP-B3965 TaxID=2663120 RepID=UPI001299FC87|nr:hypothetical protein [Chitinophaga sp. SYP-B3965]MRG46117.1 hypothetical protein [Chitinophaga sp. SYP-B3965]